MRNNNTAKTVHQGDSEAIFGSELAHQLDNGANFNVAISRAWRVRGQAEARATAPDESRIQGSLAVAIAADGQTRGGQIADLDTTFRVAEAMKAALAASNNKAHQDRIQFAFDAFLNKGRANAGRRETRKKMLRGWRKCLRLLAKEFNADNYPFIARQYADALLKIEAELAFLGQTRNGQMHIDNVVSLLPYHLDRVGRDAVVERYKALFHRYADAYRDAALDAIDTGEFKLPSLITGRDIGTGFNLTAAKLKRYFPRNSYGIRACDRDAINAEREAKGLKVRKPPKPKSRDKIRQEAAEQREIEEMVEHFGFTRETVSGWRWSKPRPGRDVYGERFYEMLGRMYEEKRLGIDPKGGAEDLTPELEDALRAHFNVGNAAIRQWRHRKHLARKIAEYRRDTALTLVA